MSDKISVPEPRVELGRGFLTEYWKEEESFPKFRGVEKLGYYFKRAIFNLTSLPVSTVVSILTVSVSIFLFGSFLVFLLNMNSLLAKAGSNLTLTAYISEDAGEAAVNDLIARMQGDKRISSMQYISKADALDIFRQEMGGSGSFLTGLEKDNPLPASLELNIRPIDVGVGGGIDKIIEDYRQSALIEEVAFGSEWARRIEGLLRLLRGLGLATICLLFVIVVFLISNTIHLILYSRQDEIAIMRLVGATKGFVRIPFAIAGALQGFFGSLLGILILRLSFHFFEGEVLESPLLQVAFPEIVFLSGESLFFLLIGGTVLGAIGSYTSLGKLVDV